MYFTMVPIKALSDNLKPQQKRLAHFYSRKTYKIKGIVKIKMFKERKRTVQSK